LESPYQFGRDVLGGLIMAVSYDKLWKILNEKNMMKTDLIRAAKISTNAMAKLGRNEDVRVGILVKICEYLGCTIDDIMDIVPEEER
jgi:DNA (cytosine-5)-methyltransferase 1